MGLKSGHILEEVLHGNPSMWLVYCGHEKCLYVEYQEEVLHGNPSITVIYCGPEKCSYVAYQEEVLHGNPSIMLVYCGPEKWSYFGRGATWKLIHNSDILWA